MAVNKLMPMTGSKCLLDTSVVIHSFKNNNTIQEKLDKTAEVYIDLTVIGELYYGAYNSTDINKHTHLIKSFLLNCKIITPDISTSEQYGLVKSSLKKKGKPLPENDIWIAAIAMQYKLPLFTTDAHFNEVDALSLF